MNFTPMKGGGAEVLALLKGGGGTNKFVHVSLKF